LTPQQNAEQEPRPPRVSVVVVSRNRADLLRKCLESVEKSEARATLQLIVVDNGSRDGAVQLEADFPAAQFIKLPKNFGLTKALNLGWRAADAEYVFFLHDDTEVSPTTAAMLADALDANPDAAAVCPLLLNESGQPAPQLGNLPPDGSWQPAQPAGAEPFPVEYPRGAALMARVYSIKAIRQIDERYGQFGADADLATQILRASKKILLVPAATVRHRDNRAYTAPERADFLLARAVFAGKYSGFGAGLQARLGSIFGPLLGFRLGELRYTVAGQKIDGTQE
jgi:GT2 family glycosyltransferase